MKREIEQTAKREESKELILQDNLVRKEEHGREDSWILEEEDRRWGCQHEGDRSAVHLGFSVKFSTGESLRKGSRRFRRVFPQLCGLGLWNKNCPYSLLSKVPKLCFGNPIQEEKVKTNKTPH